MPSTAERLATPVAESGPRKLLVDLFAGGGGMSVVFERAFGRSPDIAINHDDDALSMHRMNHPLTRHFVADIYEVCPRGATQGRPVGWLHLSPDCRHFSQAAGGQPRSKKIRGLTWIGYRWAGQVRPDVISLENVKQILKWGPLIAKRDKATGRVVKLDGTVAGPGEQVSLRQQFLVPDPKRDGQTWRRFVAALEGHGYDVEWRTLVAADFGGHTTRERLFMIARRDGQPIAWPAPTHFKVPKGGQQKWKPAAECIEFSDLGRSIFDRPKPLAAATLRRIAKGVKRYVLDHAQPFIVPIAHYNGPDTAHAIDQPLRTITAATKGGEFALASPVLVPATHRGDDRVHPVAEPLRTITAAHRGETMLATAYMMQANDGFNATVGRELAEPMTTITHTGSQQQLVTAYLAHLRGNCDARQLADPLMTVSAGGQHHGLVECVLSDRMQTDALRVAAFLLQYYSEGGQWSDPGQPFNTITTRDRLALVTVLVRGTPFVIVDIRLRMLKPRELYNGQDFPPSYVIERGHDGRRFSNSAQVRMCGNSVNPLMATALLAANAPWLVVRKEAA